MRRSLGAAAVALVVAVTSYPAMAGAKVIPVDGDNFRATGMTRLAGGCFDADVEPAGRRTFKIRKGPGKVPIGQYSSGYELSEIGYGAGAAGRVKSPTTLSRFRIRLNSLGAEAVGAAVVRYFPPNDDGYWVGLSGVNLDQQRGWRRVDGRSLFFRWRHYTADGAFDRDGSSNTIAGHAAANGGDGEGARLGFMFGCNGEPFFVDKLELISSSDKRVYDFGGFRTRAQLRRGTKSPKRVTITAGRRVKLNGVLLKKYRKGRLSGRLLFQANPAGKRGWSTVKKDKTTRRQAATYRARPTRNTTYRIRYRGTAKKFEGDVSRRMRVRVRMRVNAGFADPTIYKGDSYTAVGRVKPGKRAGVLLQRYLDGKWRTMRKGRAARDGRFRIGGSAGSVGVSYWRVVARGGKTNVTHHSDTFKLTVSKRPSGGGGGGGGGGGDDDPPPPPEDPPPPPEG